MCPTVPSALSIHTTDDCRKDVFQVLVTLFLSSLREHTPSISMSNMQIWKYVCKVLAKLNYMTQVSDKLDINVNKYRFSFAYAMSRRGKITSD